MLKYLFTPRHSTYEFIALYYITLLAITFSFWYFLLIVPGVIIQVAMTNKIHKQESIEQEMNQ
jgi:uncharacterized membrane protein